MIKPLYKYGFSLLLLLVVSTLFAASDTLSSFNNSVIQPTSFNSIVSDEELFYEFEKTLVITKALYEQLEPALKSLSDSYKKCNETKDEHICHDFSVKQQKIEFLANAFMVENHKLEELMNNIKLIEQSTHKTSSNIQERED